MSLESVEFEVYVKKSRYLQNSACHVVGFKLFQKCVKLLKIHFRKVWNMKNDKPKTTSSDGFMERLPKQPPFRSWRKLVRICTGPHRVYAKNAFQFACQLRQLLSSNKAKHVESKGKVNLKNPSSKSYIHSFFNKKFYIHRFFNSCFQKWLNFLETAIVETENGEIKREINGSKMGCQKRCFYHGLFETSLVCNDQRKFKNLTSDYIESCC